ncbi:MAG: phosphatase PAP2 family protein [Tepidisphaeraceae bacterium]
MLAAVIGTLQPRRAVQHAWAWVREHGNLVLLLSALIVAGGVWMFVEIADEVIEGDTQHFDDWAIRTLRRGDDPAMPIGPTWLHEVGRDMTALGGVAVLGGMTLAVAGYLLMIRKYHAMWLVLAATGGGLILSTVLKSVFDRERPQLVPHLSVVHTSSFPSGHSMLSAVVYLTLGVMLARLVPNRAAKVYFLGLALFLSFLVGISRVYMGVHYPTDVLAGWTAGLVWATLCYIVARQLQIRGKVEKDTDEPGGPEAAESAFPVVQREQHPPR